MQTTYFYGKKIQRFQKNILERTWSLLSYYICKVCLDLWSSWVFKYEIKSNKSQKKPFNLPSLKPFTK